MICKSSIQFVVELYMLNRSKRMASVISRISTFIDILKTNTCTMVFYFYRFICLWTGNHHDLYVNMANHCVPRQCHPCVHHIHVLFCHYRAILHIGQMIHPFSGCKGVNTAVFDQLRYILIKKKMDLQGKYMCCQKITRLRVVKVKNYGPNEKDLAHVSTCYNINGLCAP